MTPILLPEDFDSQVADAVRRFWTSRSTASVSIKSQGGTRDSVVAGKNMDGFLDLVRHVANHCGLPSSDVYTKRSSAVLPGFFRATKNWDALVIHDKRLLAVFEFKSQVGSFGNNFNNRSEEVIGSAADLWVAHHHGAYGADPRLTKYQIREPEPAVLNPILQTDPRPPFLAWLMLLEESVSSTTDVRCDEPHYSVFPEFKNASYARRYQILCERLVERRLYSAAALELTVAEQMTHRSLSPATSVRTLCAEFAGRLLSSLESGF